MSRRPTSIFGPIFQVEDRSEDPDLRIAEGSWWPVAGGVGRRNTRGNYSSILPAEKVEDGGGSSFFGPRKWKMGEVFRSSDQENRRTPPIFEEPPSSSKKYHPPRLPSDLRPILRSRRSKMGVRSSISGVEYRR